jgi:hypothetical protein
MEYIVPALLKKTITFRRLAARNVVAYEVYATYKDDTYTSGVKTELLDTIENPVMPNPIVKRIDLSYNDNATWELPYDAYLDRDYQFRLYLNGFILSSLCYKFNRLNKLITLDTVMKKYTVNDKVEMEYYQDIITKDYMLEKDCTISIKPIFTDSYTYGYHNIIV